VTWWGLGRLVRGARRVGRGADRTGTQGPGGHGPTATAERAAPGGEAGCAGPYTYRAAEDPVRSP